MEKLAIFLKTKGRGPTIRKEKAGFRVEGANTMCQGTTFKGVLIPERSHSLLSQGSLCTGG